MPGRFTTLLLPTFPRPKLLPPGFRLPKFKMPRLAAPICPKPEFARPKLRFASTPLELVIAAVTTPPERPPTGRAGLSDSAAAQ